MLLNLVTKLINVSLVSFLFIKLLLTKIICFHDNFAGLNLIGNTDRDEIWIPSLTFSNSDENALVIVDELARLIF
jgi:hypothetical protein